MKILIACEESQAVTKELRRLGHEAYSCDIIDQSGGHPEWHIMQDVLPLLNGKCTFKTTDGAHHAVLGKWDMIIAFPPCTHLAVSGAAWFEQKRAGGTDVDTGATNRKLGSDMADSVTGGGLHGKDLSKADVSVNIYAFLKAQRTNKVVSLCCAIGDETVDGIPYAEIVKQAKAYIDAVGGFEKFAEWGLY